MYVLEIETKNTIKKIKEPRKVVIKDYIFIDVLEVLDDYGRWHKITNVHTAYARDHAKWEIERAIKKKKTYVNLKDI